MTPEELEVQRTVRILIQRALLGNVTGNMYAVTCAIHGPKIRINAYCYSDPTEHDLSSIQHAESELFTDAYEAGYDVELVCFNRDKVSPESSDIWVFARAEAG